MWFNSPMADTDRAVDSTAGARPKKMYAAPTLTEYGSVAKLTMAKGTTLIEITPNKKTCL
jgi:hypothetical protein